MALRLNRKDKKALLEILRQQNVEARLYRRARMILLAASGESIASIARQLGTSRDRVYHWIKSYQVAGIDGLEDHSRSGRPEIVTSLERHQVIAAACQPPREFGSERNLWSHESLAEALVSSGLVRSISSRTVGRILQDAEIKPHRVKMWCHSRDPDYQKKMKAIVRLYIRRPKGEPVLCVDEKSGMQALSRTRELQRSRPRRVGRFEFEYKRNGTRCLFACFNIATGRVFAHCTISRKRLDFFSFMDDVASMYRQRKVHVILDNLNTHHDTTKGDFVSEWNKRHGNRFVFHYTPTHGSWLNQVELWFGIVSRRVLRYGNFRSPDELVDAIESFVDQWNECEAHPFRWTYRGLPLVK